MVYHHTLKRKKKMMNNLLLVELKELQKSYKEVLVNAQSKILEDDTFALLDEINVFWNRNRKLVECVIQYISKPYHSYVFTAATILDVDENEHYPFLCLGDYHIWDDPIYSYIRMIESSSNDRFNIEIKEQVIDTIKENIKIIDNYNDKIVILPLRMLSEINTEYISKIAEKSFLGLFKNEPENIKQYFETYKTIDDINSGIRDDVRNMIILSDIDISSNELSVKLNNYKTGITLPIDDSNDANVLFFAIMGFLSQALDIILTCCTFKFIPYVRYNVAFKYILNISNNFISNPNVKSWLFKFIISHILHNTFNKEKYCKIELNEFVEKLKTYDFETQLFQNLRKENICLENHNISKAIEIINNQLSICFHDL